MPHIYVDAEAAALIEAAVQMLEAALTARVERADPGKVISNSLTLQAHKLATFRKQLKAPPPSDFGMMPEPLRRKAFTVIKQLALEPKPEVVDLHWRTLRGLILAAEHP